MYKGIEAAEFQALVATPHDETTAAAEEELAIKETEKVEQVNLHLW